MFQPSEWKQKSTEFRYVLDLTWHDNKGYTIIEQFGKSFTSDSNSAIGKLFNEIRRRGLKPSISALGQQTVGIYTGPDGGQSNLWQQLVKSGMAITAVGVVVTVSN